MTKLRPFHTLLLIVTIVGFVAPAEAQSPRVIDLHVDLAYQLHQKGRRIDDAKAPTSPARLKRGRVGLLVLPLYVGQAFRLSPEEGRRAYEARYTTLLSAIRSPKARGLFTEPGRPEAPNRVATVLSFEGADGFRDNPLKIVPWISRGACLVGLVHNRTNGLAGSSTEPKSRRRKLGLTDEGMLVARTAYSNGALVDLAHASDAAIDDIAKIAKDFGAPLVCTHTGMRALRPIERNLSDTHLRKIAASGGVVGISLHSGHIGAKPGHKATLDDYIRHIEHVVRVAGIQHVSIGSDLDGGIDEPRDAVGAATWPHLAKKLKARGWSSARIESLFRTNAERVLDWATKHGCSRPAQRSREAPKKAPP